jgi:hypothetical protein
MRAVTGIHDRNLAVGTPMMATAARTLSWPGVNLPAPQVYLVGGGIASMGTRPARAAGMDRSGGYGVSLSERSPIPGQQFV